MTARLVRRARFAARRVLHFGTARRCNLCGARVRAFEPFSVPPMPPRPDAACPLCGSLERHRLFVKYLRDRTDLFDGRPRDLLHVAPEPRIARLLAAAAGDGYLSADLSGEGVMEQMDVTAIPKPDDSFDVIYCSHVLEHVQDDRRAMREFRRVLRPGGWAVLNVPITAEVTDEDPTVTDPAERLRRWGQDDHVRRYGPDYADRLREAGFTVERLTVADLAAPAEAERLGLTAVAGEIYRCT